MYVWVLACENINEGLFQWRVGAGREGRSPPLYHERPLFLLATRVVAVNVTPSRAAGQSQGRGEPVDV